MKQQNRESTYYFVMNQFNNTFSLFPRNNITKKKNSSVFGCIVCIIVCAFWRGIYLYNIFWEILCICLNIQT